MNSGKKFDVVLMNPPYANGMHLKFLDKINGLGDNIVSIQPTTWLSKNYINKEQYLKYKEKINNVFSIEELDHRQLNDLFNTVNGIEKIGIYVLNKNGNMDLFKYGFDNEIEYNIRKKINIKENSNVDLIRGNNNFRYIKRTDKTAKNENSKVKENEILIYTWHGGKNCYDAVIVPTELYDKKGSLAIKFNSSEEITNFKNSLKTDFMNWYFENVIVAGEYKIINYLFRLKDYSKPVTNETFYNIFNFTKGEMEYIENEYTK